MFFSKLKADTYGGLELPEIHPTVYSDFQTITWMIKKEEFSTSSVNGRDNTINLRFFYNLSGGKDTSEFAYDIRIEDVKVYVCRGNDCDFTKEEEVKYGENIPNLIPIRTGYTFDGWYTSRTGGEKVVDATMSTPLTQITPMRLYAHWR